MPDTSRQAPFCCRTRSATCVRKRPARVPSARSRLATDSDRPIVAKLCKVRATNHPIGHHFDLRPCCHAGMRHLELWYNLKSQSNRPNHLHDNRRPSLGIAHQQTCDDHGTACPRPLLNVSPIRSPCLTSRLSPRVARPIPVHASWRHWSTSSTQQDSRKRKPSPGRSAATN